MAIDIGAHVGLEGGSSKVATKCTKLSEHAKKVL